VLVWWGKIFNFQAGFEAGTRLSGSYNSEKSYSYERNRYPALEVPTIKAQLLKPKMIERLRKTKSTNRHPRSDLVSHQQMMEVDDSSNDSSSDDEIFAIFRVSVVKGWAAIIET
jgi:hypothetical protein